MKINNLVIVLEILKSHLGCKKILKAFGSYIPKALDSGTP